MLGHVALQIWKFFPLLSEIAGSALSIDADAWMHEVALRHWIQIAHIRREKRFTRTNGLDCHDVVEQQLSLEKVLQPKIRRPLRRQDRRFPGVCDIFASEKRCMERAEGLVFCLEKTR